MSVCVCSVICADVNVSAMFGSSAAWTRSTSTSSETEPSPFTSTASTKPGLATNSSAVGASNNAHVALPGETMLS